MFQPNPTKADERRQKKKKKQDELGVCRIRREKENQRSETLGSGFVVKDLQIAPAIYCQYCLVSSNKVFPNDCDIKSYYLDFKKLTKQKLKPGIKLEDIVSSTEINRDLFSGLVVIQIDPSKKCSDKKSIFTYRPFKVVKERRPNQDLQCHFIDDPKDPEDRKQKFSVKQLTLKQSKTKPLQYQLLEPPDRTYTTYAEVTRNGDCKPYGGAILTYDDNEYVVVGAMTFTDDDRISPVFFRHSSGEEEQNVPDPANADEVEGVEQPVDAGTTGNETAQQPTPEANSYDHCLGEEEQNVPDPANADEVEGVEQPVDAGTTGNETAQQPTPEANSYDHRLVTDQLISEVVTDNSLFLEKLAKYLDLERRLIMCWKHLAYAMDVPPKERSQFDIFTEHSPTEDLLNYLSDFWNPDLKVEELKGKLKCIHRNDVINDIEKGGFKDVMKVSDLISDDPKFIKLLSLKLDVESRTGNWRSLATQFSIRKQKTDQFGLRGSGPTGALFSYMQTAEGLHDLTMEQLRSHFLAMERTGLVNLLDEQNIQGSRLVKDEVVEGSELLSDIGEHLNKEISSVKNWRNLAYRLKIPPETYSSFDTSKEKAKSPTKMMFQWLAECKPDLNIGDLLKGIKEIGRFDLVGIVSKEAEAALAKRKKECAFVDGSTEQRTANQAFRDPRQMHKDADQRSVDAFNFYSNLEQNAFDKGFKVSHNRGQGDCMFYALLEQLEFAKRPKEIPHSAAELRQKIVQYLQQNPKLPDGTDLVNFIHEYPSWTSYLEEMAKDGTCGDHVILLAAANRFNTPIRVISSLPDRKDIIINPHSQGYHRADPLVLGHVHEEHYVSLLPLTAGSDEGVSRGNETPRYSREMNRTDSE